MIPHEWLDEARQRLAPHVRRTPLSYDAQYDLYLKWENRQLSGSFKLRGAFNKVLSLQLWERQRGLVTASAGNHGLGVALAGRACQAQVTVFASAEAARVKLEAMRAAGAQLRLVPGGYTEAERAGLDYAAASGATWVSPYNDGQVIAGQGTLALELLEQLPTLERSTWIVPVGGGGLISGIGACLKAGEEASWAPTLRKAGRVRLIGIQSSASPCMHHLFHTGDQSQAIVQPSLADGLSGEVEAGSLTIPLVKRLVDDMLLVSEAEIASAIAFAWKHYQERIEGSAATALAAVLSGLVSEKPCVLVISGGNIDPEVHQRLVMENA